MSPNIETLKDLKFNIQDIFDRELKFQGSYAARKTYKNFPNPCLNVRKLGLIGLPLSEREAKTLISVCQQAPFGKGTKTVVDTAVRNTWKLDATQVSFDNPQWNDFIEELLCDACGILDVDSATCEPVWELYKLLLYEPGSFFRSHQDTEKSPGMFATMVVILPSKFTGGDVHLKHVDSSKVFKCSQDSLLNITAFSWYTDVFHEVKPIETGYRLALSYNLIHKAKVPKPILPSTLDAATKKLENVFRAWADGKVKSVPPKLFYLLDRQYSRTGLKAGVLKGSDSTKVTLLSNVGTPLGFRFALVNLEYYVWGWPYNTEEETDLTLVNIHREKIDYMTPVDLQGKPVHIKLENLDKRFDYYGGCDNIHDPTEFIPEDLFKKIREFSAYHDCRKEPYHGNDGGDVEQWYRNTALLIWHEPNKDSDIGKRLSKRKRSKSWT